MRQTSLVSKYSQIKMEKRYQVFISSTFADLKEERGKVQQAVMELDCIPAGMELFPAIDEEQFEFIKKVIDDCDYYLLIIGGRYGSVSDEGVSYTEMEYRYAVSKGIKVIALLHKDPSSLPVKKSETDAKARKKLAAFRDEAAKGRLVRFWTEANELPGLTLSSLTRTIKTYPAVGWVRGNTLVDANVYRELNEVRKENEELKATMAGMVSDSTLVNDLADLDEAITIRGYGYEGDNMDKVTVRWESIVSWKRVFCDFAPMLTTAKPEHQILSRLASRLFAISDKAKEELFDISMYTSVLEMIRIQFIALGLIEITTSSPTIFWVLTENGKVEMFNAMTIKKDVDLPF